MNLLLITCIKTIHGRPQKIIQGVAKLKMAPHFPQKNIGPLEGIFFTRNAWWAL